MQDKRGHRGDYHWFLELTTRWADNDVFGHINNVQHYAYFDTIANQFLIDEGGFDFAGGAAVGYVVESGCRYFAPLRHPQRITGGIRVAKLGTSSVTYEIGLFGAEEQAAAEGFFVHVFVDRKDERATPIPARIREALERIRKHEA